MIDDLGFYTVGNEKFYNKILAIFRAQQTNLDVKWNFNDEVFSTFDWTTEPTQSLDELYKIRARQIREKYDYIVMFCSGGADSTNMLFAFLDNGLHVDEIIASAPISGLRDWDSSSVKNDDVKNTIEETFLRQIPFLQTIQTNYPNVKVTLHDYFEDMLNYKQDDWLLKGTDWMHPTMAGRYNLDRYSHLKRIAESGKTIAVVQGIDKPQIARHKDYMSIIFADIPYNNKYDSINHPNTETVFFYHSPELPQLAVKQAHVTARFIMQPENRKLYECMPYNHEVVIKSKDGTFEKFNGHNGGIYERGIIPAIYPSIKKGFYQAGKPDKMFLGNHDHWFYQHHKGTAVWNMMQSDLNNLIKSIDKRFFFFNKHGSLLGFNPYYKTYKLGPVDKFKVKNAIILEFDGADPLTDKFKESIVIAT